MGRIVLTILSVIGVAVVLVMNAGVQVDFNLLGWQMEALPVTVVAMGGFVLGVLYSFLFYVSNFLSKGRRDRMAARRQKLKSREQEIKSKTDDLKQREKLVQSAAEPPPSSDVSEHSPGKKGRLAGMLGLGKGKSDQETQADSDQS